MQIVLTHGHPTEYQGPLPTRIAAPVLECQVIFLFQTKVYILIDFCVLPVHNNSKNNLDSHFKMRSNLFSMSIQEKVALKMDIKH